MINVLKVYPIGIACIFVHRENYF